MKFKSINIKGWVLYDGDCGFCDRYVRSWEKTLNRLGFAISPLQADWVKERLDMPPEKISEDFRLLLNNNQLISGADVYLYVMKRIWWTWPLALIFSLPGFYWIFSRTYQWVNRNRYRISKSCGLPGHFHGPSSDKD